MCECVCVRARVHAYADLTRKNGYASMNVMCVCAHAWVGGWVRAWVRARVRAHVHEYADLTCDNGYTGVEVTLLLYYIYYTSTLLHILHTYCYRSGSDGGDV